VTLIKHAASDCSLYFGIMTHCNIETPVLVLGRMWLQRPADNNGILCFRFRPRSVFNGKYTNHAFLSFLIALSPSHCFSAHLPLFHFKYFMRSVKPVRNKKIAMTESWYTTCKWFAISCWHIRSVPTTSCCNLVKGSCSRSPGAAWWCSALHAHRRHAVSTKTPVLHLRSSTCSCC